MSHYIDLIEIKEESTRGPCPSGSFDLEYENNEENISFELSPN